MVRPGDQTPVPPKKKKKGEKKHETNKGERVTFSVIPASWEA
jgi:hypothetical protein